MNCPRADTDPSGLERLLGNPEARCGWTVVAAHVVERRHNQPSLVRLDFELACGLHRASSSEHRMGDVLSAHLPLRGPQLAARHDVDHPVTLGHQSVECRARNLDRRDADSASRLRLLFQLRWRTVVVRG